MGKNEEPNSVEPPSKKVSQVPVKKENIMSIFSIQDFVEKQNTTEILLPKNTTEEIISTSDLVKVPLSQPLINECWEVLLSSIKFKEQLIYSAIKNFQITVNAPNVIEVFYPTEMAKSEFDKVAGPFFNEIKNKTNRSDLSIIYTKIVEPSKNELLSKKQIFQKMMVQNPTLIELNEFFKFDFS